MFITSRAIRIRAQNRPSFPDRLLLIDNELNRRFICGYLFGLLFALSFTFKGIEKVKMLNLIIENCLLNVNIECKMSISGLQVRIPLAISKFSHEAYGGEFFTDALPRGNSYNFTQLPVAKLLSK